MTDSGRGQYRSVIWGAAAAGLVCLLVYLRTLGNDFIYTDDPAYVYNNDQIRHLDWQLLVAAFSRLFAGDYWMPLTWISFAIDYHFWGLDPTGYHLTNSLIHAVNTGLVVLITDRLLRERFTGDASRSYPYLMALLFSGLLWGLHPLRVESVAWVTERKDVLNGMFSFGALLVYLDYARERALPGGHPGRYYLLSLVLFVASLLAKPSSLVIPAIMLVADWYPLGRGGRENIGRLVLEKVPFGLFSVAITVITIAAKESYGGLHSADSLPFLVRLVLSGNAVFEYVSMTVWPVGIIFFTPLPKPIPAAFIVKAVAVAVATIILGFQARKRPWLTAPWVCFLLLLLPVLSFMHTGIDVALAPRFTYLASFVASVVVAAALAALVSKYGRSVPGLWQRGVTLLLVALIVCVAGISSRLISTWRDTETLWTRQIDILPLGRAYNARGHYYLLRERYPEAIRDFSTALDIAARSGQQFADNILAFRGEALRLAGEHDAAVRDFSEAIRLNPRPRYLYHRGLALQALGKMGEAEEDFRRAGPDTGRIVWFAEGEE